MKNASNIGLTKPLKLFKIRLNLSGCALRMRIPVLTVVILLLLGGFFQSKALNRFSVATGNWSNTAIWAATSGGAPGATVPAAGDNVTIEGGFTVTVDTNTAVIGNLSIANGSILTVGAFTISVSGASTISGTINFNNATGTKTFTGDVTLNNGAIWNESAAAILNFAGNFTNNATTFTATTGLHTFSGATKTFGGSTSSAIPNLTFTGAYALSGALTVSTLLTVTGTTLTNNGNISATTALSGTGGVTQGSTGVLNLSGTSGITTLTATAAGNTVNFNGAVQTAFPTTYSNLTLSGSGAKTFATTPTVNGILSLEGTASVVVTAGVVTYGTAATLQYNKPGAYITTPEEWISPFTASGGIVIQNSGIITLNGAKTLTNCPLTIHEGAELANGGFTIASPSAISLDGGCLSKGATISGTGLLTLGGDVTVINSGTGNVGASISSPVALTNATTRTFTVADDGTSAVDLTISAIISTTGNLVKAGAGTLQLSRANTYTGTTTVNTGTLQAGIITNAFGTNSAVTLANTAGAVLDLAGFSNTIGSITGGGTSGGNVTLGSGTLTVGSLNTSPAAYAGIISGTGGITKSGTGILILAGDNTFSGLTTVSAGTLKLGANGGGTNTPLGTVAGGTSVTAGAVLDLNGFTLGTAEPLTLNGTGIAAAGALTNTSATAVTYSGLITLGSATSIVSSSGAITLSNTGTITGPTFGLTLGGTIGGTLASIIGTTTGTVTKAGTSTWILSGASTYSGLTTISAGTLKLGAAGNATDSPLGSSAGATSVTSGAVLDLNGFSLGVAEPLTLNGTGIAAGGALTNSSASAVTYSGLLTMGSAASIVTNAGAINLTNTGTVTGAFGLTLSGTTGGSLASILGTAAGTLTKAGTGIWIISGLSTYTGITTISAGTLKLGASSSGTSSPLGTAAGGTTITAGAALDLAGFSITTTEALTINSTGISNGGALTNSGGAVTYAGAITFQTAASIIGESGTIAITGTIASSATAITLGGTSGGSINTVIAGARTMTKIGSGVWTFSGANTYSGATTVSAGTLRAGSTTNAFGTNSAYTLANVAGVVLDLAGFNNTIGSLTGGGTTGGSVTLGSGTLTIGSNNTSPAAYAGVISGTGGVTKSGTGILILAGDNTYSGLTAITAGTLKLGASGGGTNTPLGTTAGATSVTSGAALDLNGFTLGTAEALTLNGTGIAAAGALINSAAIAASYSGLITLGSAASIVSSFGAISITNSGTITGSTFGLTLGGTVGGTLASIIGTGTGTVTKAGTSTWTLSGASTYSGITTISAGILKLGAAGNATNTPLGTTGGITSVTAGAALDLNGFTLGTAEPLTLNGTGITAGGALTNSAVTAVTYSGAITFASAASIVGEGGTIAITGTPVSSGIAITLGGTAGGSVSTVIAGARTITKIGTGAWTLSGANTYTGVTTISAGTLKLGASSAVATSGPLGTTGGGTTVAAGAALDMNGFSLTAAATEALSLNGTGISNGGALANSSSTAATYIGVITFATAASIVGETGTIAITGTPVSSAIGITLGGSAGGSISTVIAGARTLTKIGSGVWTLTGANTYTLATTISAGELRLNPAANITPASQVILSGGILGTTAITATRTITSSSTLQMTANSSINLGSSVHTLKFASSSGVAWTGTTLTINGWTGTAGASGSAGKIYFGAGTGTLTAAQLSKIVFTGYPATPILLVTGELVPGIPPPTTLSITGTLDHGSSCIGSPAAPITYTITNPSLLTANGVTVISNNGQFVVSSAPTSIAPGGTATFVVTFTPSGSGLRSATVTAATTTPGISSGIDALTGTGDAASVAGTATIGALLVCPGSSTTASLSGYTGTIQWQQSADGISGWSNVSGGSGATTASYSTPALSVLTYYRASVTGGACASVLSNVISVDIGITWTGTTSTDWNNAGNWSCGAIPDMTDNVLIPNVTNKPILGSGAVGAVNNLNISTSGLLTISGNTLQIAGTISNSGTLTASAGSVEMIGSVAQTIPAGTFSGNNLMNLTISNTAGVTLGGALNITGILSAATGDFASGGFLKLISSSSQTALIDGSGSGQVTGSVTMQRYLPSAYGYKFVSSPFSDATVAQYTGYFSSTATIPAFYTYNEDNQDAGVDISGWVDYSSSSNSLAPGAGYAINLGAAGTPLTIEISGQVNNDIGGIPLYNHNGTYTQGFNLVGNPYPSPINWDAFTTLATDNIDNFINFFQSSGDEYSGTFTSYVNGVSSGTGDAIIPSMQGFFVHVMDGSYPVTGTLNIPNSVRTNDLNPTFKKAVVDSRTILRFEAAFDGATSKADPFVIYFDPTATTDFDKHADALKMMNTDEKVPNLYAFTTDFKAVSINGIPAPTDSITKIPLGLTTYQDGWVNITVKDLAKLNTGKNLYLFDYERGILQNLNENPAYRFYFRKGVNIERFALLFSAKLLTPSNLETNKLFAITSLAGLPYVSINIGNEERGILLVSNLLGQTLLEREVYGQQLVDISSCNSAGVLLINLRTGSRSQSQKTILRK